MTGVVGCRACQLVDLTELLRELLIHRIRLTCSVCSHELSARRWLGWSKEPLAQPPQVEGNRGQRTSPAEEQSERDLGPEIVPSRAYLRVAEIPSTCARAAEIFTEILSKAPSIASEDVSRGARGAT